MKTFYFNTGVHGCHVPPINLHANQVWMGGTVQIPFECDGVPDGALFMFGCDDPYLSESKNPEVLVVPVQQPNPGFCSKFAYFRLPIARAEGGAL